MRLTHRRAHEGLPSVSEHPQNVLNEALQFKSKRIRGSYFN
jgi:hypothetical protein